ncbi:MAG: hypothetical protein HRT44_11815 [Bdellovibrionales bacterium]|nr:hypothetical protein [Bdellovibrionales bacterium]
MAEQIQLIITRDLFDEPDSLTFELLNTTTVRPYAEYEEAGYLIFSSAYEFNSRAAKRAMAQNLPKDVTLVIYTYSSEKSHINGIKERYSEVNSPDR